MKKVALSVLLFLVTVTCVFAFSFNDFSVKYVTVSPLFKPFKADSWSVSTRAQYINLINSEGIYQTLACTRYEAGRENDYYRYDSIKPEQKEDFIMEVVSFREKQDAIKQLYRVKTGFTFSLLSVKYKDIAGLELNIQGALNLLFDANNGTDCLGFDGVYFYGVNGSLFNDLVSFRVGKHHYSGHYGDEIEESFMLRSDNLGRTYSSRFSYDRGTAGYISRLIQYVRQDSLVIGLSTQPTSWVRVYGELDCIPKQILRVRPWLLCPENIICSDDHDHGQTLEQSIGESEGVYENDYESRVVPYDSSYKDMSIETGIEFTIPVKKILDVSLAFDLKFFQEAETGYQIGSFDKDRKWDIDYNILLGIKFEDMPVNVELIYHKGRFPLMNFFWQQCSYWSAGFSIEI